MGYRKYDPMVKKMIIETGNRNLFPELNIPRTTVNYWLKESKERVSTSESYAYEKTIDSFKEIITLKEILKVVGISQTTYYRWRVEYYGCNYHNLKKKCVASSAIQLTMAEQRKLVELATSVSFRKFSTVRLMHYCRRKGILHISLESWYKYLRLYGIERKFFKQKRKRYAIGIRARNVNEIWHIDITVLKYADGEKAYLQILIDNYSRMIVAWKLSKNKSMDVTYRTIMKSFVVVPDFKGKMISDAGTENLGSMPRKLLIGKGIKQLVAKRDIRFSNSMVEAVFRQFKQKFYLKNSKSFSSLYRLVYNFVKQYNQVIPHSSLGGGTPQEIFRHEFVKSNYEQDSRHALMNRRHERRLEFRSCNKCSRKFLRQVGT